MPDTIANPYGMMLGGQEACTLARGTVLNVNQEAGTLRVKTITGAVYEHVRVMTPSQSLSGTGVSTLPIEETPVLLAIFSGDEAFVVGTYTPFKPGTKQLYPQQEGLTGGDWAYFNHNDGHFILHPTGVVDAFSHSLAHFMLLPRDHMMRGFYRKWEHTSGTHNRVLYHNLVEKNGGVSFYEHMVNDRYQYRVDDQYANIMMTQGRNVHEFGSPTNPQSPWLHYFQIERRPDDIMTPIKGRYREEIGLQAGVIEQRGWWVHEPEDGIWIRRGSFNEGLLEQAFYHADAEEVYYEDVRRDGRFVRINPAVEIMGHPLEVYRVTLPQVEMELDRRAGALLTSDGSYHLVTGKAAYTHGKNVMMVGTGSAVLKMRKQPAPYEYVQLTNGQAAYTMLGPLNQFFDTVSAPRVLMGIPAPPPTPPTLHAETKTSRNHERSDYTGVTGPFNGGQIGGEARTRGPSPVHEQSLSQTEATWADQDEAGWKQHYIDHAGSFGAGGNLRARFYVGSGDEAGMESRDPWDWIFEEPGGGYDQIGHDPSEWAIVRVKGLLAEAKNTKGTRVTVDDETITAESPFGTHAKATWAASGQLLLSNDHGYVDLYSTGAVRLSSEKAMVTVEQAQGRVVLSGRPADPLTDPDSISYVERRIATAGAIGTLMDNLVAGGYMTPAQRDTINNELGQQDVAWVALPDENGDGIPD